MQEDFEAGREGAPGMAHPDPSLMGKALPSNHRTQTSLTLEGEAAVGRIAIWAAWTEEALAGICNTLISPKEYGIGETVTATMSSAQLIHLARKLLEGPRRPTPENRAKVLEALSQAQSALEERNKILHGVAGSSLIPGKTTVFTSRRRKLEGSHYGAEDLDAISARLYETNDALWDCWSMLTPG